MRESLVIIEPAPIHSMDGDQPLIPSSSQNAFIVSLKFSPGWRRGWWAPPGRSAALPSSRNSPPAPTPTSWCSPTTTWWCWRSSSWPSWAGQIPLETFVTSFQCFESSSRHKSFILSGFRPKSFFWSRDSWHVFEILASRWSDPEQSSSSHSISQLETFTDGFSNASRFSWFMNFSLVSFFV